MTSYRWSEVLIAYSCVPLQLPMPNRAIDWRIQGKSVRQLAGADSRHVTRGVALTMSKHRLSDNRHRHEPLDPRPNSRFHNRHHRPAACAQERWPFLDPGQRPTRSELQYHMQQSDQPLAVGVQKPKFRPEERQSRTEEVLLGYAPAGNLWAAHAARPTTGNPGPTSFGIRSASSWRNDVRCLDAGRRRMAPYYFGAKGGKT